MAKVGTYKIGRGYAFHMLSGRSEPVIYLGKNKQGMHQFVFRDGQVWTGYAAPVSARE